MDRKTLIREYKETRRPMGVYRVLNTVNQKSFVGTSIDLPSMLNRQQSQLRMGGHPNRALQKAVADNGLTVEEYLSIFRLAQTDSGLREKIINRIHPPK